MPGVNPKPSASNGGTTPTPASQAASTAAVTSATQTNSASPDIGQAATASASEEAALPPAAGVSAAGTPVNIDAATIAAVAELMKTDPMLAKHPQVYAAMETVKNLQTERGQAPAEGASNSNVVKSMLTADPTSIRDGDAAKITAAKKQLTEALGLPADANVKQITVELGKLDSSIKSLLSLVPATGSFIYRHKGKLTQGAILAAVIYGAARYFTSGSYDPLKAVPSSPHEFMVRDSRFALPAPSNAAGWDFEVGNDHPAGGWNLQWSRTENGSIAEQRIERIQPRAEGDQEFATLYRGGKSIELKKAN